MTGKAKPKRLVLRKRGVDVSELDRFDKTKLVEFTYLPPKGFKFDGIEMYPRIIKIRINGREPDTKGR